MRILSPNSFTIWASLIIYHDYQLLTDLLQVMELSCNSLWFWQQVVALEKMLFSPCTLIPDFDNKLLPLRGCCFPSVLYFLILTTSCCPWEDVVFLLYSISWFWQQVVALERMLFSLCTLFPDFDNKLLPLRGCCFPSVFYFLILTTSCCPWEDVVFPLYSISWFWQQVVALDRMLFSLCTLFPDFDNKLLLLRGCCFPSVLYFLILTKSCCPW